MQIVQRENNVVTNGIKDSVSFGIKQDGLAHIFSVLRNHLGITDDLEAPVSARR